MTAVHATIILARRTLHETLFERSARRIAACDGLGPRAPQIYDADVSCPKCLAVLRLLRRAEG
jgi:hypothetical protein